MDRATRSELLKRVSAQEDELARYKTRLTGLYQVINFFHLPFLGLFKES